jgi:transcriptional antiterminator RfaH
MEKSWLALYTKPRSEFKAEEQLTSSSIQTYLPTITKLKQWSDRKKKVTEPLFRGYIFIYADEQERLISVEKQAIVRCLFDNGRPARIPEWQIDNIRKMLESDTNVIVHNGIVPGAKVKIKSGSFQGVIGTVINESSGKSISVSIDLLNRSVVARLPDNCDLEVVKEQ